MAIGGSYRRLGGSRSEDMRSLQKDGPPRSNAKSTMMERKSGRGAEVAANVAEGGWVNASVCHPRQGIGASRSAVDGIATREEPCLHPLERVFAARPVADEIAEAEQSIALRIVVERLQRVFHRREAPVDIVEDQVAPAGVVRRDCDRSRVVFQLHGRRFLTPLFESAGRDLDAELRPVTAPLVRHRLVPGGLAEHAGFSERDVDRTVHVPVDPQRRPVLRDEPLQI